LVQVTPHPAILLRGVCPPSTHPRSHPRTVPAGALCRYRDRSENVRVVDGLQVTRHMILPCRWLEIKE